MSRRARGPRPGATCGSLSVRLGLAGQLLPLAVSLRLSSGSGRWAGRHAHKHSDWALPVPTVPVALRSAAASHGGTPPGTPVTVSNVIT